MSPARQAFDRPQDIEPLARHFVVRFGKRFGRPEARLTPALLNWMVGAMWPGNVRELEHSIERRVALAASDVLDVEGHPPDAAPEGPDELPLAQRLDAFERGILAEALRRLGVNRSTMISKLKKYALA